MKGRFGKVELFEKVVVQYLGRAALVNEYSPNLMGADLDSYH